MGNLKVPGDESFHPVLQNVLHFSVKRDLDLWPRRVHEHVALLLLWRGEYQALKLSGHVGGPWNGITVTEPEALQVLQLINFLQLQAH